MPNLTKHLYKNFKLLHRISVITDPSMFSSVVFMTALMSNICTILYSSTAKTLRVTFLHSINNQCMIFALFVVSAKQIISAIRDNMYLLLANDVSVKTTS